MLLRNEPDPYGPTLVRILRQAQASAEAARTAKALGLVVPQALLQRADEVIE